MLLPMKPYRPMNFPNRAVWNKRRTFPKHVTRNLGEATCQRLLKLVAYIFLRFSTLRIIAVMVHFLVIRLDRLGASLEFISLIVLSKGGLLDNLRIGPIYSHILLTPVNETILAFIWAVSSNRPNIFRSISCPWCLFQSNALRNNNFK